MKLPHEHGSYKNKVDLLDENQAEKISKAMKQLGDPKRLQIFWFLCHREECVLNIAAIMDMSSPAVSHHLRILKLANLIESKRMGKEMFYKAKDNKLSKFLLETTKNAINL
ncbi:winged helix-turn-helix transcriptional regulator [Anaerococcus sp. AGMB00486]|uniref:Winged helix-turn-helix transcriptional regulator n=2 Tax=Anaerococcus TaxID=165779 RepID=A0ABX2N7V3_9FIRM|nr:MULTISPECIES: metalloregulator ArsR/SmtB family transcription factor [Anaerococcus]MDY3006076.1 metalloregulator ArsR/SmtB family transcription factor [Anaerococcus porci]MSS78370.1 winged helix-turn-helix transcriptional regulator [Anaerococcus porci]NVF10723.1 winged helix-turn-helix transcriptional regulator [Anaerococcus faecalis]